MKPRLGIAAGLLLIVIGMIVRMNSHSLAWPQATSVAWTGLVTAQDIYPYGFKETALNQIAIMSMAFGGSLSLLSLHWYWKRETVI